MRTSPTNIGLWMLSALAARDFGYVTGDQVVESLGRSLKTIGQLERYEGHLLNWYDIQSLKPLEPRYVSTVDSGNLLGALWSLEHGLQELIRRPVLERSAFEGLRDTGEVFREVLEEVRIPNSDAGAIEELLGATRNTADGVTAELQLLRRLEKIAGTTVETGGPPPGYETGAAYWSGQVRRQISAWMGIRDRYLLWVEIIKEKSEHEISPLGADVLRAIRRDLKNAPSLHDLATGQVGSITILRSIYEQPFLDARPFCQWLQRIIEAFDRSKWLAGEMLGQAEELIQNVREFSESIDMRFLYDVKRKLFAIGFSVSDRRRDSAFYDLLASEARIGSYVAIARGEVPIGALVLHGPTLFRDRPPSGASQLDRYDVRIPDAAPAPTLIWELTPRQG